jgi:hypothetical protein
MQGYKAIDIVLKLQWEDFLHHVVHVSISSQKGLLKQDAFFIPCSHHASQRTFSTNMSGKEQSQFQLQAATNEVIITNVWKSIN